MIFIAISVILLLSFGMFFFNKKIQPYIEVKNFLNKTVSYYNQFSAPKDYLQNIIIEKDILFTRLKWSGRLNDSRRVEYHFYPHLIKFILFDNDEVVGSGTLFDLKTKKYIDYKHSDIYFWSLNGELKFNSEYIG